MQLDVATDALESKSKTLLPKAIHLLRLFPGMSSKRSMGFLQFNFDFNLPPAVGLTIADPDLIQTLPVTSVFVYREPRSCHEVDSLQSQSRP